MLSTSAPHKDERTLLELLPRGGCIIAETGRGPSDAAVRAVAARLARAAEGDLVLYDRSAASWGGDPFPSGPYTAQVDGPHGERSLRAGELEALGRGYLRDQLVKLEREGVPAQAWLPRQQGVGGLVDAVDRIAPHLVLLNGHARRQGWLHWLRRDPLLESAARIDVPSAAVDADGAVRILGLGTAAEARSRLKFMADVPLRPVRGTFRRFDVRVQLDPESVTGGTVEAVIEASSLETGRLARDMHLRSRALLDAARSPHLVFRSSSIAREADTLTIEGELTIRGETRPVTLWGTVHELSGWQDGRRRVRVRASAELRWRQWGIASIPFLSDRLAIAFDIVGVEVRPGSGRFNARSMAGTSRGNAAVDRGSVNTRTVPG